MCPVLHLYVLFITDQYQKKILGRLYWSVNAVIAGYIDVDVESITPTALALSLYSDIVGYCTQRSNAFFLIRVHQFMSL